MMPLPPRRQCLRNQGTHAGGFGERPAKVSAEFPLEPFEILLVAPNLALDPAFVALGDQALVLPPIERPIVVFRIHQER